MLNFRSMSVQDYLMWKNSVFEFEEGITVVNGPNRSGKTVLFRALSLGLWGSLVGKRGTEASRIPDNARIALSLTVGDANWLVEATQSKVSLAKNGDSIQVQGKVQGLDRIRDEMRISYDLYDTTIHISGTSSHPLTHASPSARMDWFSALLGLDGVYDELERNAAAKHRRAQDAAVRLDAIEHEISKLSSTATPETLEHIRTRIATLGDKLKKDRETLGRMLQAQECFNALKSIPASRSGNGTRTANEIRTELERAEERLTQAKIQQAARKSAYAERTRLQQLRRERMRLRSVREKFKRFKSSDPRSKLDALRTELASAESKYREWTDQQAYRRQLAELLQSPPPPMEQSTCEKVLKAFADEMFDMSAQAKALRACPTCGNKSDPEHVRAHVAARAERFKTLYTQSRIARANLRIARLRALMTIDSKPRLPREVKDEYDAIADKLKTVEDTEASLTTVRNRILDAKTRIAANLSGHGKKIDMFLAEKKVRLLRMKLEARQAFEANAQLLQKYHSRLEELGVARMSPTVVSRMVKRLQRHISRREPILGSLTAEESFLTTVLNQKTSMETDARKLEEEAGKVGVYEELRAAFGRNGVRMATLQGFVAAFENALNSSAPLLWDTPAMFSLTVSEKGVNIQLTRNNITSDLTTLSGSEERVWKLLCAVALIRLLPNHLRSDTIILDEIEAHMDARSRYLFGTDFLRELQTLIPKIVLISPLSRAELPIDATKRLEVVRKGDKAVLVQR